MKKFFMAVIALMMTVSVSAQFYIYLSNGSILPADSISMVAPSDDPVEPNYTPMAFTINANGDKVFFSQGNLQYQASTNTWRFAEHQYDLIGSDNSNISSTYSGWIDLFGWGTGSNPTNTSTDYSGYSTFVDWGVNAISNGGNTPNQWRTLTKDEWVYLCETRTNAANLRSLATVNGVHGYIFFPDDFVLPIGFTFLAGANDWAMNVYSARGWSKLEAAGAVFLPAAGYRDGTHVGGVGSDGGYWSATPGSEGYAYNMSFNSYYVSPRYDFNRYFGQSVRLVQDL